MRLYKIDALPKLLSAIYAPFQPFVPHCISSELYSNSSEFDHLDAPGEYGQRSLLTAGTPNSANTGDACSETGT